MDYKYGRVLNRRSSVGLVSGWQNYQEDNYVWNVCLVSYVTLAIAAMSHVEVVP